MVQAIRPRSSIKVRFLVGISSVILVSMCVAASLSRATSAPPRPAELADMESNDANFLLNALPSMKHIPAAPSHVTAPKVKKVTKAEPTSEASIMQHDIDSLKKNLKTHLEKETSDHIQLNTLHTDKEKATQVEHSLEAKIAAEKLQLRALEGHPAAARSPAPAQAPTASKQSVPSPISAASAAATASDKKAQAAMLKALQSVKVPSHMKSHLSSDVRKVRSVIARDAQQKQVLAGVEMKISNVEASEARDKASLHQLTLLEAKLKGAAHILRSRVAKEASRLNGYVAKQDQLAPIVQRDEARDQKLKTLVSAIWKKKVDLEAKPQQPVRTRLFELGPVILTELAQSVAELSHSSQPTDLTFTNLVAESTDTIKDEMSANEVSLAKVKAYLKTVDSEERAFREDLKLVQKQEIPIRAGLKAMADI